MAETEDQPQNEDKDGVIPPKSQTDIEEEERIAKKDNTLDKKDENGNTENIAATDNEEDIKDKSEKTETDTEKDTSIVENDDELEDENLGNSKLHRAAMNFEFQLVDELVRSNKKYMNKTNKKSRTAAIEMVLTYTTLDSYDQAYFHKRFVDILTLMIEYGLDVNKSDYKGRTALHYVVSYPENTDVIRTLHAGGARINSPDNLQLTALHLAAARGDMETVKTLMDAGADPNIRNSKGQSALHIAAKGNHHAPVISFLIRCGANVNVLDKGHQTPLHVAAKVAKLNNVEELIRAGAKPDLQDSSGQSPLHLAAAKDTTGRVVSTLLECNVDINLQDKIYMETPLHKTVRLKMLHNFKLIVEWRPDPNIKDLLVETPLHKAAALTDVWVWSSLMKIGANAMLSNHVGLSAYQKAIKAKNNSAVAVLRQYGIHDF